MHRCRKRLRSNGGVIVDALLSVAAVSAPPPVAVGVPFVFSHPAPDAVVPPDPPRRPAKKQKVDRRRREAMPPEYVKGPGKPGHLHPHWRKSFPDDEADADGRGKVVDVPDALRLYGVWRRVPGFWKILASDEGFIATEGEWVVRTPTVGTGHYLTVHCNGKKELVHLLVCRAFKGRPTPEQVSVDHEDRDESNNCKDNLKWATAAQQRRNQGECKAHSDGEPCLVWRVKGHKLKSKTTPYDMTRVGAAQRFPSVTAASEALGLNHGNLSGIFNGKRKTDVGTDGKRYAGEWDPDLADIAKDEEWKEKAKSTGHRLFVSNYGRLQFVYTGGRKGTKHYPESSHKGYLRVQIDGQDKYVHVLVGELFFIGPYPDGWKVWDHIDQDKQNNHILNLRPVTVEENNTNTARQRDFYIWPEDDPDDWERCVSQHGAARAHGFHWNHLNALLHKRPDKRGSVPTTVGGYCAAFCDEVDSVES